MLGQVRTGQAVLFAAGAISAIAALDQAPSAGGAILGTLVFAGGIALAVVPVAGRTLDEWGPLVCVFALRRPRGRGRFLSPTPLQGHRMIGRVGARGGYVAAPTPAVPAALGGVRIIELEYRDRVIGALSEDKGRRLSAVLACRADAFALLDPEAQERRLSRWGVVLASSAGTSIRRVQWLERTVPTQGDELARWLHDERHPSIPLRGTPMIESYLELIGTTAKVTQEHEILLAVQIDARRVRGGHADAAKRALLEQTERVAQSLEAAEVTVQGALSPSQTARVLRTAFDPYARAELAALETADAGSDRVDEHGAWPLGTAETWDCYRSDGAVHSTYWIAGWPRADVSPMFMGGLLSRSSTVRTVAVTFEPIPPARSTREVETAVTRDRADRELRHRFGQSETARQRQAQEATIRREAELAAGHAEVRFSGFVTVSGRDREELRRASIEVLEHAARARLELRSLYGQQAEAFTFTLPLCRGLR